MTKEYKELHLVIAALIQKLDALSLENAELKKRLSKYEIPKKQHQKFNSPNGAFIFAVLRLITDTVLKNKQNIICSVNTIAYLQTDW